MLQMQAVATLTVRIQRVRLQHILCICLSVVQRKDLLKTNIIRTYVEHVYDDADDMMNMCMMMSMNMMSSPSAT